jgi:hypothetical protein
MYHFVAISRAYPAVKLFFKMLGTNLRLCLLWLVVAVILGINADDDNVGTWLQKSNAAKFGLVLGVLGICALIFWGVS